MWKCTRGRAPTRAEEFSQRANRSARQPCVCVYYVCPLCTSVGGVHCGAGAVWQRTPKQVSKLAGVSLVDAACGGDHTLALDASGQVWAFGRCEHGQCFGAASRPFTAAPTISQALTSGSAAASGGAVRRVLARGHCSCALGEGEQVLRCIGRCQDWALAQKAAASAA